MTDISVIKMIISVAVWRIYPSWVNDKFRAWEGLGHSGMFWARALEGRFSFEARNYLFSFQSYVRFEEFFCFPRFWKIWRQMFKLWGFWVGRCFGALFENSSSVTGNFLRNSDYDHKYFLKISFLFSKAEPVLLAWQLWRSQLWAKHFGDGTSKTGMKTRLPGVGGIERRRTIDRRRDRYESCAMIHGPEEKEKQRSQRVIVRRLNLSSSTNQRVLRSLFPRPDEATVSHFAVFVDVDVQLQDGQAVARGQRRKAVIRDISGVDHWGVTNLSAPIWFAGQRHCTVFRHVMQLSLFVLRWKST